MSTNVLVIDDNRADFELISHLFESIPNSDFTLQWEGTYEDGVNALKSNWADVCLLDYKLGARDGLDLLQVASRLKIRTPIIVLSGIADREVELRFAHEGARDYLSKDELSWRILERSVRYTLENAKKAEKLRAALQEREVLLKEVHHRVKNNLQIIVSMLRLQARVVEQGRAKEVLELCRNRVHSIALVHETLHQSGTLGDISMSRYLAELISMLRDSDVRGPADIEISCEVNDISLPLAKAIPCGLIVHELVSNSIKHAYSESERKKISVRVAIENENICKLTVQDWGRGFDPKLLSHTGATLGVELINALTKQMEGDIFLSQEGGTQWEVRFPLEIHPVYNEEQMRLRH